MKARRFVERVLVIAVMAVALWAVGAGTASAQSGEGYLPLGCGVEAEIVVPCTCGPAGNDFSLPICGGVVTCGTPEPPEECDGPCPPGTPPESITCTGVYTPGQRANVFTFGGNNSIQVKFDAVTCPSFVLEVTLTPTAQEAFRTRVTPPADGGVCLFPANLPYPPNPDVTCNETVFVGPVGNQEEFCAVYTVGPPPPTTCYTQGDKVVGYTIGWLDPEVKGNKHDYMLLRDPDGLHLSDAGDPNAATTCFSQDITDRLLRNYTVGTIVDPGLSGRTCCTSDYVVAKQRVRPVKK